MSFILSWSGYFSRKGWDPKAWARVNNIESYEQCVKRISKMCVKPPTEDQYRLLFLGQVKTEALEEILLPPKTKKKDKDVFTKTVKPEQKKAVKIKKTPESKSTPKHRTTKKVVPPQAVKSGSGTDSIIDSVKRKTATRKSRSRKNVKSS